jgi:hypothetical protein
MPGVSDRASVPRLALAVQRTWAFHFSYSVGAPEFFAAEYLARPYPEPVNASRAAARGSGGSLALTA